MKILHIVPYYYPAFKYGGPATSLHIMNKTLVEKGVDVSVFTTNAGLEKDNLIKEGWQYIDGVRVKYFPYFFKDNYTFSPQMFIEILKEVKYSDLVHITMFWNFQTLTGSLGSIFYKKPYIICPAGALSEESITSRSTNIKKLYFYLIAQYYSKQASAFMLNSYAERDELAVFLKLKNKTFVIPNGIDLDEFSDLPKKGDFKKIYSVLQDKKYLLFLGRIHKKKGLDLLVETFKELTKEYNDLCLVIAGPDNGNYLREIQETLKVFNLLNRVILPGVLSGREKLAAYVDAEAFILPSYSENFALVVIEALACGTPVVISDKVALCKEIKEENAGVVVELNSKSLLNGIKMVLNNPALAKELATNGSYLVKNKYNIDKVADIMIKAYQSLLEVK